MLINENQFIRRAIRIDKMTYWLAAICVIGLISKTMASPDRIDLKNPVRSAEEDRVKNMPSSREGNPNLQHYSGYLLSDLKNTSFTHYWLTNKISTKDNNDKLLVWLSDGPGCSSLFHGLNQGGPARVESGEFVVNMNGVNEFVDVLYLEGPVGVGYSYSFDPSRNSIDDATATRQLKIALENFMNKFPKYQHKPIYISGSDYGSVFALSLAAEIGNKMNVSGVLLGNGFFEATTALESSIFFTYHHGLVGDLTWNHLSRGCCNGKSPAPGKCSFFDKNKSKECHAAMKLLGDQILGSGLNLMNVIADCERPSSRDATVSRWIRSARIRSDNPRKLQRDQTLPWPRTCVDDTGMVEYLNREDVREALHIPDSLIQRWITCSKEPYTKLSLPFVEGALVSLVKEVWTTSSRPHLLFYNGDTDLVYSALGVEWFVNKLGRKSLVKWIPWHDASHQVSGYVKHYDLLTYTTVLGSGHWPLQDHQGRAKLLINNFLRVEKD